MWETEENIKILNVLERVVGINTSSPSTAWIWKLFSKYEVCVCCLQWTMEIFEKLKQKLWSKQCRLLVSRCSGATGGLETWVDMGGGGHCEWQCWAGVAQGGLVQWHCFCCQTYIVSTLILSQPSQLMTLILLSVTWSSNIFQLLPLDH